MEAPRTGRIPAAFTAKDCTVPGHPDQTRLDVGTNGVMVPLITDAEKKRRRETTVRKRRVREAAGRKPAPLPRPVGPGPIFPAKSSRRSSSTTRRTNSSTSC